MTEDAFLSTIREKPNDDTTRLIYADWLDEQSDEGASTRAAFLRADCELAGLTSRDKRRKPLEGRRRQLARRLEAAWLAVVSKLPIERCSFAYECPLEWENLSAVEGSDTVRYCEKCEKNVYYSSTLREARQHARQRHCVAVSAALVRKKGDLSTRARPMRMGRIRLPVRRPGGNQG